MLAYTFLKQGSAGLTPVLDLELLEDDAQARAHAEHLLRENSDYVLVEVSAQETVRFSVGRAELDAMALFERSRVFRG